MSNELKEKFRQAVLENDDSQPVEIENQTLPKSVFIIPCIVFFVILTGTYFLNPYTVEGPQGKINSPSAGSKIGREVQVAGEVKSKDKLLSPTRYK